MKKSTNIIIRVNEKIKTRFQELVKEEDTTISFVLNECMIQMISKNEIPDSIKARINPNVSKKDKLNISTIKKYVEEAINDAELINKIEKVYLFGSYSRNEESEESDIDIRIEYKNHFDLFDLGNLSYYLEKKTGKKVDIATKKPSEMEPSFYNSIKKDEICIYQQK